MDFNVFSDRQKRVLVDLLVLGMYADGNLDMIENERAKRVLDAVQFPSESERQYFLDASFARARKNTETAELTRQFIADIAKEFPTPALRRLVYNALEDSLTSDKQIAQQECELLSVLSREFDL